MVRCGEACSLGKVSLDLNVQNDPLEQSGAERGAGA